MNNLINKKEERYRKFLSFLDFKLVDGIGNKYCKEYTQHKYKITCDFEKNIIDYGNLSCIGRNTICSLKDTKKSVDENLVVLECVNRLLEKGYKPKEIELEKSYGSGRKDEGQFLDILLKQNGEAFALIECKTFGAKHREERQKMNKKGGQLFNYFANETKAKYLILYSSSIENPNNNECDIIKTDIFKDCTNNVDRMKVWDRTTESNGFFESTVLYNFNAGLRKQNLIPILNDDIYSAVKNNKDVNGTIFNRFAEILRRHTVSDKINSYNKIFNLFLCKIIDEDSASEDKILDFQWINNETEEDVISRLSTLYKKGMQKYMELDVTDHTEKEFEDQLKNLSDKQEAIKMFQEIRLYKNNEFAFKEVINKRTFYENAKIVKEVVKLLEKYQIKYSCKQAFLGDFFERLLNIGIKQEAGQFFTPMPIARFIVNSIPLEKIIEKKISDKEKDFMPHIIDYACGSGHFLTEVMDRLQNIIDKRDTKNLTQGQKSNISLWKTNKETNVAYIWARDYIYGIEKDYRLVKTTKIACFLNGDGEANIIYGDGLESFGSEYYRGILKQKYNKENKQFDVVIANPPFSVECFKETLENGEEDFELFNSLGERSDDIECLFIERTAQLLKDEGICAVILPSTILTNGGIHSKARKLFIENFELRAIQKLHGGVFAATPNTTVVLFGIKRQDKDNILKNIDKILQEYLNTKKDINYNQNQNILSKYCNLIGMSLDEFTNKITIDEPFKKDQLLRLKFFLLTQQQYFLIGDYDAKGEKGKLEKIFLGYEHSSRQKYEGIRPFPKNTDGKINSKLYTDNNPLDNTKVSSYIHRILSGEKIDNNVIIDDRLKENISITTFENLINWKEQKFSLYVDVDNYKKKNNNISWKYKTIFLKDIKGIKIHKGYNAPQEEKYFQNGEVYFVRAGNLKYKNINYLDTSKIEKINQLACDELKINTVPKNTILFSISGKSVNTNNIAITSHKSCIVNHLVGISITDEVLLKFLFYFLSYYKTSNLSTNGSYPTIKIEAIQYLEVPIPPLKIQQKIVDEIEAIEKSKKDIKKEIESLNDEVAGLVRFDGLEVQTYKFDEITTKNKIKTDVQLNKESWYNKGKYPIISQEQEFISGYTDKEDGLILNVPLITFGDHSLTIKYIDFPFFYGGDGLKFIQTNDLCKLKIFYYLLQNSTKKLKKSKDYARHFSKLKELDFNIPLLHKQNEILVKIEKIEAKIKTNKQTLIEFINQKNLVVEKHLID